MTEEGARRTLRVGVAVTMTATRSIVHPRPAEQTAAHLKEFCAALAASTGLVVEPVVAPDYPTLLDTMQSGGVDLAWLPPVLGVKAISLGRAFAVALPVRWGVASFHTAMFAREGTRYRELRDILGARAVWVDPSSAAGYVVIRAALRSKGLGYEHPFSEEKFVGSHDAVARAVMAGEADVGATYVHFEPGTERIRRAGWGDARVQIVTKVGPIPADIIAASVRAPNAQVLAIQKALVGGLDDELRRTASQLLEADSFIEAETAHLEPLASLLRFLDDLPHRFTSVFPPSRRSSR